MRFFFFFSLLSGCVQRFCSASSNPGASNLSGTLFRGIIKDCLSGLPQLSWWSLA